MKGLDERIKAAVQSYVLTGSPVQVIKSQDPMLDAWKGAASWASKKDVLQRNSITRTYYEECGGDYIIEHGIGNRNVI